MALKNRIAVKLIDYAQDTIGLNDLRDWLAPIVWDIEDARDLEAESLAYGAELALAEFDHGHLTEGQLKSRLLALVPGYASARTASVATIFEPIAIITRIVLAGRKSLAVSS